MPFCETCAKYWAPSAASADGTCPTCGRALAKPRAITRPEQQTSIGASAHGQGGEGSKFRAPWHFKLLMVGLIIYLGYRLWQLIMWLMT